MSIIKLYPFFVLKGNFENPQHIRLRLIDKVCPAEFLDAIASLLSTQDLPNITISEKSISSHDSGKTLERLWDESGKTLGRL